jgi:hypothetical protein
MFESEHFKQGNRLSYERKVFITFSLWQKVLPFSQRLLAYPLIFILICMQQGTSGMNL